MTSMTSEAVRGHSTLLQEEVQLKFKLPLRPQNSWPPRPPRSFEAVFIIVPGIMLVLDTPVTLTMLQRFLAFCTFVSKNTTAVNTHGIQTAFMYFQVGAF